MKDDESTSIDKYDSIDREVEDLKQKIKEIEEKLRELRTKTPPIVSPVSSPEKTVHHAPTDNSEQVTQLEKDLQSLIERVDKHDGRLDSLENDNGENKDKIRDNQLEIDKLKEQLGDKVDADTFDTEVTFLKELLNNLGSDKKVDIQIPVPKSGMSTKDANKLKELAAKLPEIEKSIKDILERLGRAEKSIDSHDKIIKEHDKTLEEILAELAKKANRDDLKELLDRVNRLADDLDRIIEHVNSLGKGSVPRSTPPAKDNKRLENLERRLDDLRNDLMERLRNLEGSKFTISPLSCLL